MSVLALRDLPARDRNPAPVDGHIAEVTVFADMAAAEPHWRALEQSCVLATPYQHYDFLKLWQRHVGAVSGVSPFIVVGFNPFGTPLFLWPLGLRHVAGLRVAEFLGGKHANFNMALWRSDVAGQLQATDLKSVLDRLGREADLLKLTNQPLTWGGATNPFALLPRQRAANYAFSGGLIPDFDALLRARTNAAARKKMRKKERTLAGYGTVRFARAEGKRDVRHALDVFFKQKSARMRTQGLHDVFTDPNVRRFVEDAATTILPDGYPLIELYTLSVDDMIVATMGGIVGRGRFCAMFNSITTGRYAVESPGEQLIVQLVRQCCERGLDTFDLGIGRARYKNLFCGDAEPLFDSFLPLSPAGWLPAHVCRLAAAGKRAIKQREPLWALVQAMRSLRARLSPAP
jgi:CelD/BcsL family acetyltransferase involved in cellulose biosynthesis